MRAVFKMAIAPIAAIALLLSLCACSFGTVSLTELPKPEESVNAFFACLKNGDYEGADRYINNYQTLGFSSAKENDELIESFYKVLIGGRSYGFTGASVVSGREAFLTIRFTTLDFRKLEQPLTERVVEDIKQRQYIGETFETKEEVLAVVSEQISGILSQSDELMTTDYFDLELKYDEGIWKFDIGESFYSALIGYAA